MNGATIDEKPMAHNILDAIAQLGQGASPKRTDTDDYPTLHRIMDEVRPHTFHGTTFSEVIIPMMLPASAGITTTTLFADTLSISMADSKFTDARKELAEYGSLHQGWDGYNGVPFRKLTIKRADELAQQAATLFRRRRIEPDKVVPGPSADGSIDLEISYNTKSIIVTIGPDSKEMRLYSEAGEEPSEQVLPFAMDAFVTELSRLAR